MKKTKKAFIELLNKEDLENQGKGNGAWRNGKYHQRKRLYGDYLYHQDRIMFDVNYNDWLKEESEVN